MVSTIDMGYKKYGLITNQDAFELSAPSYGKKNHHGHLLRPGEKQE